MSEPKEMITDADIEHTRLLYTDGIDFTSSAVRDWFRWYIPLANVAILKVEANAKKAKAWDELIDFMQDRQGQPMWLAMERMSELMKEKP